jgi:phosphopentomutase
MDYLRENGINTYGVGKIWNIFDGQGIQESIETIDNNDGMIKTIELAKKISKGFFFINLIDFDMNYGHRRDIAGFKKAIEEFDTHLSQLETLLEPNDAVILTADHGNDPGFKGTDHTREYVPFLYYQKGKKSFELGIRETFADIGQTIIHTMTGTPLLEVGTSIFSQ